MTRLALPFAAVYVSIALGMFLLMRDRGYHPTDDGFMLAFSWRITQGEVPYRDFIFERPPLTPYLHAVWLALPDGWQIQAGRLAFYLELSAASLFPTLWAVSRGLRATMPTLAIAAGTLLIALHNFPPMPWPTVDGVFFASAGVASFLAWRDGRRARWLVLSLVALTLASLAKQTFAPLPVVAGAYGAVVGFRERDLRTVAAAALPPAVIGGAFLLALVAAGALEQFLQQLWQPTQIRPTATNPWSGDMVATGLKPYLVALTPGIALLLGLVGFVFVWRERSRRAARFIMPILVILLVLAAVLMPADPYESGFVIFYGVAVIALAEAVRTRARGVDVPILAYALVLLTGWCASLSFAYQSPILAVGMAGPLVATTLDGQTGRFASGVAAAGLLVVMCVSVLINVELPYRDVPREEQTADLYDIYPRFGHLYTNEVNAQRHRELRDLSQRYAFATGRNFVVFSAFPLAHFLTRTNNPVSADWLEPQEFLGNDARLQRELETSGAVMIVQRQKGATVGQGSPPLSCADTAASAPAFAQDSLARASLVAETEYFCVYTP
ncbi:MAG TPA: hypothetical protein VIP07_05690 [Candidatus Limnocylindria bacterium]